MSERGLGRAQIVAAALRILDEYGLPDLSMRRLAADLGVRPSALYWHVENKQTLLAAVADRIVSEAGAAGGLADTARAVRRALLAHRDGAEVVLSSAALALGDNAVYGLLRDALAREAHPDPDRGATVLAQFLLGHASLVQQRMLAAVIGAYDQDPGAIDREALADFDAGIRALRDGLGRGAA
ncbi:TetR family transcriptional regulator [Microbacterium excoecariae]|uniref:TetR family transcriptional regulator n=1 Tax=Microbacterium excoecariae TaxID=2715210 RepID=UPI00140D7BFB|nr:TetR family transcriptional regulator [Microbacterium excoecariae]NHI16761.1 TetR family transcriptional regulator [Microbacterium excoecariae]